RPLGDLLLADPLAVLNKIAGARRGDHVMNCLQRRECLGERVDLLPAAALDRAEQLFSPGSGFHGGVANDFQAQVSPLPVALNSAETAGQLIAAAPTQGHGEGPAGASKSQVRIARTIGIRSEGRKTAALQQPRKRFPQDLIGALPRDDGPCRVDALFIFPLEKILAAELRAWFDLVAKQAFEILFAFLNQGARKT